MKNKAYFLLGEMTHLRYFIPLIKELNKRKLKSCFLIYFSGKYNCPSKHSDELNKACERYNVEKTLANNFKEKNKIIFCVEKACHMGIKRYGISHENNFYVLTSQFDYLGNYDLYASYAKNIFFASKWFLDNCDHFIGDKKTQPTKWCLKKIKSPKNIFLGSPKYDIKLDKQQIISKYNLTNKKKILFLFPSVAPHQKYWITKEARGLSEKQINSIYDIIRSLGFEVLVKSRLKHPILRTCLGDRSFYDESWFPHTTMELMEVSDLAIMVDSTSMKECILQKTPFINIGLINEKEQQHPKAILSSLTKYEYCKNYDNVPDMNELKNKIKELTSKQFSLEFEKAINKHLFQRGSSSQKIIDFIEASSG
tara:strand:+ start:461 stop:1561 length:1101 start_codon:yes stop_codon:yes gene_type:complete